MAMFKQVATDQLKVLLFIFLLGNGLHAVPPNPSTANACGSHFYPKLVKMHYHLVVEIFVSAMLLLAVRMVISIAEANAILATCVAGRRAPEAGVIGLASVPAGWKRCSLGAMFCLAVDISMAASYHAIVALEDGYLYRTGCHHGYSTGTLVVDRVLMCLMTVVTVFSLNVARSHN